MQNNQTIAIIGAMDCEISLIKDFLSDVKQKNHKSFSIYEGEINNNKIILAKAGVGKVAASSCTQHLVDNYNPDYIINTGVAGGLGENLKIGDVVIADSFIEHDFDATALGYAKGYVCNGINSDKPTVFYSDKNLIKEMQNSISEILPLRNIHTGLIVSGDSFVADIEKKAMLKKLFNAIATEMEGAAIAHCATLNEIPFVALRTISDLADGTKIENYAEFEIKAAEMSANLIKAILSK